MSSAKNSILIWSLKPISGCSLSMWQKHINMIGKSKNDKYLCFLWTSFYLSVFNSNLGQMNETTPAQNLKMFATLLLPTQSLIPMQTASIGQLSKPMKKTTYVPAIYKMRQKRHSTISFRSSRLWYLYMPFSIFSASILKMCLSKVMKLGASYWMESSWFLSSLYFYLTKFLIFFILY